MRGAAPHYRAEAIPSRCLLLNPSEAAGAMPPNEQERYDRRVAAAREDLGNDAFSAAWADGRAMSMQQAIDYALSDESAEKNTAGEE